MKRIRQGEPIDAQRERRLLYVAMTRARELLSVLQRRAAQLVPFEMA